MFQTFDEKTSPADGAVRLARLRAELKRTGLSGFVVPHADEHQSEYLPPSAERLAWLTGFTGSAGMAIVLETEAAVFVDGRYTLQVATQIDVTAFAPVHLADSPPTKWLASRLRPGDRIGFDPWLLTAAEAKTFAETCNNAGAELVPADANPLDAVWTDRPAPPTGTVSLHSIAFAGEAVPDKLDRLRTALADKKVDFAALTQADSIAWTFNIRGADIPHTPVALAFALLRREGAPLLFIDGRKLTNSVRAALAEVADIHEPAELAPCLAEAATGGARILFDSRSSAAALESVVLAAGGTIVEGQDPTVRLKAIKNPVEIEGSRRAHLRDGVAVSRFLAWLDRTAPDGSVDEIAAAERLEDFRREVAAADGITLADLSFDTISGAGPNGAIVHYRVTRATNRRLDAGSLYLVDSGGQYRDGTTDITRTVAIGSPSALMRDRFTRVLKGHIGVATARFPEKTPGAQLDGFARQALWRAGLDYDHGTGHGVGSFLSVHEEAARISKTGQIAVAAGMIISNEPGYYRAGAFGIRIENLVLATEAEPIEGGDRPMLGFETLTLAPIDRRLIEPTLMSAEEIAWLDAYHGRVREALSARLEGADRTWLEAATAPLQTSESSL